MRTIKVAHGDLWGRNRMSHLREIDLASWSIYEEGKIPLAGLRIDFFSSRRGDEGAPAFIVLDTSAARELAHAILAEVNPIERRSKG